MNLAFYTPGSESIVLDERYKIKGVIGKGGMGTVYEAEDLLLGGVKLAVKFLLQSVVDEKMKRSFLNEAKICAFLGNKSINIVRVMDYGVYQGDVPYYVMEYLSGKSLKALLEEDKSLSISQFLSIARQTCIGLAAAHDGITINNEFKTVIHRDIKPANIFIAIDPLIEQLVKILDFGIAKFFSEHSFMTQTNTYIGTLAYSSPEQIEGINVDERSDIYSLGVMLYEMLTKQFPWNLVSPSFGAWYKAHHYQEPLPLNRQELPLKVPEALESLILSCLEKDPKHRPQNVRVLIHAFEALEQELGLFSARNFIKSHPDVPESKPDQEDENLSYHPHEPACETQFFSTNAGCKVFSDIQVPSSRLQPEEDKLCWTKIWPENKPISEIVFPTLLKNFDNSIVLPSVWVMFPLEKIRSYFNASVYNHFILSASPYPVLLWLTAIYRHECGVKFLPCYLDLMDLEVQKLIKALSSIGYYSLLFFNLEAPHTCQYIRKITLNDRQQELLLKWLKNINTTPSEAFNVKFEPLSKEVLKREYISIKKKITQKFESSQQSFDHANFNDLDDVVTFSHPKDFSDLSTSAWI